MRIDVTQITTESQILEQGLDEFAASFDHEVPRLFPIWTAHIKDRLIAYSHLHSHVLAYPAIHPSISPREFYELTWRFLCQTKKTFGDPLIALPHWEERLLAKFPLEPFKKDLYSIRD